MFRAVEYSMRILVKLMSRGPCGLLLWLAMAIRRPVVAPALWVVEKGHRGEV